MDKTQFYLRASPTTIIEKKPKREHTPVSYHTFDIYHTQLQSVSPHVPCSHVEWDQHQSGSRAPSSASSSPVIVSHSLRSPIDAAVIAVSVREDAANCANVTFGSPYVAHD
jgi:hypothetical protein